jgi:RHS repeat-associated protein
VIYDVNGGRVAERLASGISDYNVYIGDAYVHEHRYSSDTTDLEIKIGGDRVALKRFNGSRRGSSASVLPITYPLEFWFIGLGGLGGWLVVWCARRGEWVLVYARPIRSVTAMGAAGSLVLPSIAMAGGAPAAAPPTYYWEISDQLGTGMVLLDETGERLRHQTFSPFGRVEQETGPGLRTFYAGHRRDEESGMFYMQARWYDPDSGRFSSVDPLIRSAAVPQSVNPYSYAENNPVNGYDPTGLLFEWFISQDPATNEVHVWTQSYSPSRGSRGEGGDSGAEGAAGSSGGISPGSGGGASLSVGVSVPGAGMAGSGAAGAPSSARQFQSGSDGGRSSGAGNMDLAGFESPGLNPSPGAAKTPGGAGAFGAEQVFELFDGGARSRAEARIDSEIAVRRVRASQMGGSRDVYAFVIEESIVNVATGQRRFVDLTLGQNVNVPAGTFAGHVPVPHSIYPGRSGFFQRVWIPRGPALIFRAPFVGPGL